MTSRADELLDCFLQGVTDPSGCLQYELLEYFFSGYPVEHVGELIESEHEKTASLGAWIASELGAKPRAILSQVVKCLSHQNSNVRSDIVGCLLNCLLDEDWQIVLQVADKCLDEHQGVRWRALSFLTHLRPSRIEVLVREARLAQVENDSVEGFELLLMNGVDNYALAKKWLAEGSQLQQAFATALAARTYKVGRWHLGLAKKCLDPATSEFAEDTISEPDSPFRPFI